jgi:hypothetical protein
MPVRIAQRMSRSYHKSMHASEIASAVGLPIMSACSELFSVMWATRSRFR